MGFENGLDRQKAECSPLLKGAIMAFEGLQTRLVADVTFIEPVLGTNPGDPDILINYLIELARKQGEEIPPELEVEHLRSLPEIKEEADKKSTFFLRDEEGHIFIYDYMFKGLFKSACQALYVIKGTASEKVKKNFKKRIARHVFVYPRKIILKLPEGEKVTMLERPLRAQTPQGERVSIARSEMVPAGTACRVEIMTLMPDLLDCIEEWMDYGELKGIGQWRNAGYGRFKYEWVK
ncbi:MAG: hypothetical protein GF375_03515 [Candidatus Omnitrophica bacterium]|nr:hypothetical protein [Candidatus Omnitrophota bacterium]